MRKKRKWLIYALLATGLAVVGLLFFTLNRGPLVTGFQAYESAEDDFCLWCEENRPTSLKEKFGLTLIILLILILPAGHIALLITAVVQFNRPPPPARAPRHRCPHCRQGIDPQWKACPYCGETLPTEGKQS
jgi:hypothetical protein